MRAGIIEMNNWVGLVRLLSLLATLAGLIVPLGAQGVLEQVRFERVVGGLDRPLAIVSARDGSGRLFIVQQGGQIRIYDGQQILSTPFLDISNRLSAGNERGLLGLAFHPHYQDNGFFYVNYTRNGGDTVIARFSVSDNSNIAAAGSEQVLLVQDQPFANHNGGDLHFGPDGYLYMGLGDGGDAGDPGNRAQNLSVLLGKMLRIDVDNGSPYGIPATNPFASQTAGVVAQQSPRPEIWAYGLRNPWRFSFDRQTGDLFIGDVGQNLIEEVDFQAAASHGGENYGWRRMEGASCFNPSSNCNDGTLTLPILTYRHDGGDCSVTGGYRYRGAQYPQLQGMYFYGDYCTGRIHAAVQQGANWTVADSTGTSFTISTFGEDEAGELYVADHGGGVVYRIASNHPAPQLTSLAPSTAPAGSAAFALMLRGSNFTPGAQVTWNGEARATTFVDNTTLQAEITGADVANQGAAQVAVNNPAPGGGASASLPFVIGATVSLQPSISESGVVNAANFSAGEAVAPGSIVSVFGVQLASGIAQPDESPLPTMLNGTTLQFESGAVNVAAPQFYQSSGQLNVQVPWELTGSTRATARVSAGANTSDAALVSLAAHAPGLFTMRQGGQGQGAITIAGTGLLAATENTVPGVASRPARKGEFLEVFATGLGPVTNTPATGAPASATPPSETTTPTTATIGGENAPVSFAGLAPGFVGLYQINVAVPATAPSGDAVELKLTIGGVESNAVTLAVE